MNFETKVRGLMRELIEPIVEKGQRDRELILRVEKLQNRFLERLNQMEESVYNVKPPNVEGFKPTKSKFEYIEDKIV
jgi:hypothetical protein